MWEKLFRTADVLQTGLHASWMRNELIRNNIANAETPNFKGSDLDFHTAFVESLEENSGFTGRKTRGRHIDIGTRDTGLTPLVVQNEDLSMRMDGNNVDIEAENVKLAQNSLYYNTLMVKLNSELSRLKTAIKEGK
ncbi:MAG: flagellar basal body rod protein FlgB [Oscillospiraceae bacterium]|nr:flagellar basal body rod protein FlgB [Oscillospiraceae bacterium]